MSVDVAPQGAQSLDDLAGRLAELRVRAGGPSYSEIAQRIAVLRSRRGSRTAPPGRVTVYDVFRTGRSRMDIELVADVVTVLGRPSEVAAWRHAHTLILRRRAKERGGRLTAARGRVAVVGDSSARTLFGRADDIDDVVTRLLARRALLRAQIADGQRSEPEALLVDLLANTGDPVVRVEALRELGRIAELRGEQEAARARWLQALEAGPEPILARKLRQDLGS